MEKKKMCRVCCLVFAAVLVGCSSEESATTEDTGADIATDSGTSPDTATNSDTSPATQTDSTSTCGNGALDPGEACDDGPNNSDTLADACRTHCQPASCGDGVIDLRANETCDDGNQTDTDACNNLCRLPACGDGIIQAGEECDEGPQNSDDIEGACPTNCLRSRCGDGTRQPSETCDDGNTEVGDYCSPNCEQITGVCGDSIVQTNEACDNGNTTTGIYCSPNCQTITGACGDNLLQPTEACDDANTASNDGCSNTCSVEFGYDCTTPLPSTCTSTCGDGRKAANEDCDDQNVINQDGCNNLCAIELGYYCSGTAPSICQSGCGDGIKTPDEPCDDANNTDDDGCNATCGIELGFSCDTQSPSTCESTCGDGIKTPDEPCDDANNLDNDGCLADCQIQPGYACSGSPSVCLDLDECALATHTCGPTTECVNNAGSFDCYCAEGYSGDGLNCDQEPAPGTQQLIGTVAYRFIPAGVFIMGSPSDELGRQPIQFQIDFEEQHPVRLTRGFWMKETEVTQAEWQAVMGYNPAAFSTCGPNCPVENVNWSDTAQFCNALSALQGLTPCYTLSDCSNPPNSTCISISENPSCTGFRLPTEAEWERAYRADTQTPFYNGEITQTDCTTLDPNADAIGWYCANASGSTHPVATKAPNPWGLYDMAGNVYERVWDKLCEYKTLPHVDPKCSSTSPPFNARLFRGGAWDSDPEWLRAAFRAGDPPLGPDVPNQVGFRIVRTFWP